MKRVGFRGRLFVILLSFALLPSILLSLAWGATSWWTLPLVGATAAWDSVASTGERALSAARGAPLTPEQRSALTTHERMLNLSAVRARQAGYIFRRAAATAAVLAIIVFLALGLIASRVAGHLSRNLSRPLQELVGWTERIGRGEALPQGPPRKGAPEFALLRERMRVMARELELGRTRALEAERAAALRESARQVAHELKNPLTPIRFAVARLRREAPASLAETVEVLEIESRRLEEMARTFSQFGRLPEGPASEVDIGELVRYTARSTVPQNVPLSLQIAPDVPMVEGHHDALARALSNIMINAVDACRSGGSVLVDVRRAMVDASAAVEISVTDTGCGIPAEQLPRIWDPYVTHKPGGTGLGLAIARQTIVAHRGRVRADSAPGRGTRISLLLPVNGAAAGAAQST